MLEVLDQVLRLNTAGVKDNNNGAPFKEVKPKYVIWNYLFSTVEFKSNKCSYKQIHITLDSILDFDL